MNFYEILDAFKRRISFLFFLRTRQRWPSLHNLEYVILFMKILKINKVRSTKKVSMIHKPVRTISICSHQRV